MDRTRVGWLKHDDACSLAESKERLRQASRAIDPLAPLRRHPGLSVATAAVLGVVAGSPGTANSLRVASAPLHRSLLRLARTQLNRVARSHMPSET